MGTFAEDLLLLITDEEGHHGMSQLDLVVAGAHACELAATERLTLDTRKRIEVLDSRSTGDELLDEALVRFGEHPGKKPASVIQKVSKGMAEHAYGRLARDEQVTPHDARLLGLKVRTLYVPVDPSVRERLRAELVQVLSGAVQPDARTGSIISLVRATTTLGRVFPSDHRGGLTGAEVRRAAKQVSEGRWGSKAVADVIASMAGASSAAVVAASSSS